MCMCVSERVGSCALQHWSICLLTHLSTRSTYSCSLLVSLMTLGAACARRSFSCVHIQCNDVSVYLHDKCVLCGLRLHLSTRHAATERHNFHFRFLWSLLPFLICSSKHCIPGRSMTHLQVPECQGLLVKLALQSSDLCVSA